MIETDRIYLMDCMEGMKQIADSSVDAIIADLPYGVLNRSNPSVNWDRQIPFAALWEHGSCCRNPGYGGTTSCGRKIG